jgi:hypothetical protein
MGRLISDVQRAAAMTAAIRYGKELVAQGDGFIPPQMQFGRLTERQWEKLAEAITSGWIIERSKQLTAERIGSEMHFLATGRDPEPSSLGNVAAILPALGGIVEERGLTDKTIGEWTKEDVLLFVYHAHDLICRAETLRDERPTEPEVGRTLMAG